MIISFNKEAFDMCKDCGFIWRKINEKFYILHLYGNEKKHPIGYYIPVFCYVFSKKS